jgi:hypothetical protein
MGTTKISIRFLTLAKYALFGMKTYPNGGFLPWILLLCSPTKTIIQKTETIGSTSKLNLKR